MVTDFGHEQAAVTAYINKSISDMLKSIAEPLPQHDHTYAFMAARGELFGAPATTTKTFKERELGLDLSRIVTEGYYIGKKTQNHPKDTKYLGIESAVKLAYDPHRSANYSGINNTFYH